MPTSVPPRLQTSTTPNHHDGAPRARKAKATKKVMNPTPARSTAMLVAAMRMEMACSSLSARTRAAAVATRVGLGMRTQAMAAAAKATAARRTTHGPPRNPTLRMITPGMAAANPARTDSTARRELAVTSSRSSGTVMGTSALLVTMWAFDSTSTPKASGNSHRLWRWLAIERQIRARLAEPAMRIRRRPAGVRSRTGPRKGATTAKGAMVRSR